MALNRNKDIKLYYSIKEAAEIIDNNESTIRYWETRIPQLRPKTTANGTRQYTKEDIDLLIHINNLVKVRGYRIEAAKKMLHVNKTGADKTTAVLETLIEARDQLKDLKKQLDLIV